MAIPAKEDFDETVLLVVDLISRLEERDLKAFRDMPRSCAEVEDYLQVNREIEVSALAKINKTAAMRWLDSHPAVQVLYKKFNRGAKKKGVARSEEELISDSADAIFGTLADRSIHELSDSWRKFHDSEEEALLWINSSERKQDRFRERLKGWSTRRVRFSSWRAGVLAALREYFYSDRWKRLLLEYQDKEKDLENCLSAFEALEKLSRHLLYAPRTLRSFPAERAQRKIEVIKAMLCANVAELYPIRRRDETAKERVLVYDLYQNNKVNGFGKKADAIGQLMGGLEGIENPPSPRAIEKYVSAWSSAEAAYRQKIRDLVKTSPAVVYHLLVQQ